MTTDPTPDHMADAYDPRPLPPAVLAEMMAELDRRDKIMCASCGHRMNVHTSPHGAPFPCRDCDCPDYVEATRS